MPHKVLFHIVAVSGEDEHHRAKELNVHGPTVQGWHSSRFCTYPQEIILQLEGRTRICKIQILSHQFLIATQIKICVGDTKDASISLQNVKYKQLGYISLSDNERTNFKARELKSIHVDVVGTFVRFIIQKNHQNRHNVCNQVGIVAINIIGDAVGKSFDIVKETDLNIRDYNHNPMPGMVRRRPELISPLDDLTFDMYQDPEVAQIIRKLEEKKQEAVRQERYEFAKKLKIAITDLYKAGETLGKYEIEKKQAIDMEDYDKARRKKAQLDQFRLKTYEHLELPKLLEVSGTYADTPVIKKEPEKHVPVKEVATIPHKREQLEVVHRPMDGDELLTTSSGSSPRYEVDDVSSDEQPSRENGEEEDEVALAIENGHHATLERRPKAAGKDPNSRTTKNSYTAYEERALPGLREKHARESGDEYRSDSERAPRVHQSNMTEQDKRQASLPIDIFGIRTVQLAYSKLFSDREDALDEIRDQVMDYGVSDVHPAKLMRAATFMLQKGLKDPVLSVFNKSLDLLTVLLSKFPIKYKVPKSEIAHTVEKVLPELINKLGDKAQRQRSAAHQYILEMMDYPEVRAMPSVPVHCCQPLNSQVQPRLAQGQAELVEALVHKLGVERNGGIAIASVMAFSVPALQHPAGPVRETAERIIVKLYRDRGRELRRYLPPNDSATRKNMIYRQLFETFDKMDEENKKRRASIISNLAAEESAAQMQRRNSLAALPTPDLVDRMERTCIFCDERNSSFTSDGLDLHYWKHCPMLVRCNHCKQVVEISGLTEHLLEECSAKDRYDKCKRCLEAIPKRDYEVHTKLRTCKPAKLEKGANRCPLCHKNIGSGEASWKSHLMGRNGCEANPRRKPITKQVVPNDKMKKSQSADRALAAPKSEMMTTAARMSRSTTRTFNQPTNRWR